MSYIAYLNGTEIELSPINPIALTRQVNDLGRLDNRQSNVTNTFTAPLVAKNIKAMEKVYLTGNQSNIPYQKNSFDLVDMNTGKHLIYKGWANVKKTSDKGYEIYVYDGVIDFYKTIENKSLTDIGMSGLNHLKNLTNVVNSFENDQTYMYILADYNGRTQSEVTGQLCIDYLVPSARVSFIWNRIFEYAGYTYTGSVFSSEAFLNLFMTYPKPVPINTPVTIPITDQDSVINTQIISEPTPGGGVEYITFYTADLLPVDYVSPILSNTGVVLQAGAFRFTADGVLSNSLATNGKIEIRRLNSSNVLISSNVIDGAIPESIIIDGNVGDKFVITAELTGIIASYSVNPLSGIIHTTIELIEGYDANFDDVLMDFKATDFINEIMQRFGLTQFKNKYTNHIDFLTLKEILQDPDPLDWSKKYGSKGPETYIYSNYAQLNKLVYRYNEENETHNDGVIKINNVNLKEEITIINSKIYTHEKKKSGLGLTSFATSTLYNESVNIYKIWNKELKEVEGDTIVQYKELSGRFYFLRFKDKVFTTDIDLISDALNTETLISHAPFDNYDRLKFQEIVYDYYGPIESVLDKSKIKEDIFYLTPTDVESFTFKKPIYLEQYSSYYIVNRIVSFIKGKPTKCELIEVDYLKVLGTYVPPAATYITITDTVVDGCEVTFTFDTDATLPTAIQIYGIQNNFGLPPVITDPWQVYDAVVNPVTNSITINTLGGQLWEFFIKLTGQNITSNTVYFSNIGGCTFIPTPPDLSYITITNINTYQIVDNTRKIRIDFTTDLVLPSSIQINISRNPFGIVVPIPYTGSNYYILLELDHIDYFGFGTGPVYVDYQIKLLRLGIESNTVTSNS